MIFTYGKPKFFWYVVNGVCIAEVMDGKRVLMHQNHGVIVCAESVAAAFDTLCVPHAISNCTYSDSQPWL